MSVKVYLPKAGFVGTDGRHYRPDPNTGQAEVPTAIYEQIKGSDFIARAKEQFERRKNAKSIYASERKNDAEQPKEAEKPDPTPLEKLIKDHNRDQLVAMAESMGIELEQRATKDVIAQAIMSKADANQDSQE